MMGMLRRIRKVLSLPDEEGQMDLAHPQAAPPSPDDLAFLSIREAAALVRERQVSPVELTRIVLERIGRRNAALNAYITVTADWAFDLARQAEREIGEGRYRGPLHGIPIGLKDLFETAGIRTTAGSRVLADHVPTEHAPVVAKLLNAGAVVVGKHNMHEFAAGFTNINPFYGTAHTPWNLSHMAGGSSGGTAAAIAVGMCFGGLGSDTGGSIRVPASYCGISGIKPTYGRVSKRGVTPLSGTLDHVGPMARSAADCSLLLRAIAGYDPSDVDSADVPTDDYAADLDRDVAGLRIGIIANYLADSRLDPEVRIGVQRAIGVLTAAGARVDEVEVPDPEEMNRTLGVIVSAELAEIHAGWVETRVEDYSPELLKWIQESAALKATRLSAALRARRSSIRAADQLMRDYDALVGPTTPYVAPTADVPDMGLFTESFDLNGLPALSVPCGFTQAGLPIGLMIVGRRWAERTVLRIGSAYQQLTDWHRRRPPEPKD
jgi:aspartyl-tRNA(Asn)/glutamyl-tRNA(Gln) amidotransferase subunit A